MALAAAIMPLGLSAGRDEPPTGHTSASDFPDYLSAWRAAYPASTLPERMEAIGLSTCVVCHAPSSFDDPGTCYREDLRDKMALGMGIVDAIIAADGMDSDGDGVANGVEILMVRRDQPGERGYHPGLIGAAGTDPCSRDPNTPVSNQPETPPPPCYADCDGSGVLDIFDFLCFQNSFVASEPYACDCDPDPVCNIFDFLCFQSAFVSGCP